MHFQSAARTPQKSETMKPYDANGKTLPQLTRDNKTFGDVWILTDGYRVSIYDQRAGKAPSQGLTLPRARFNRIIDWYLKNQPLRKPKKAKRRRPHSPAERET